MTAWRPCLVGLVALWCPGLAPAAEGLPSSLMLELSVGDDDRRDAYADLDLAFVGDSRLLISAGQSHTADPDADFTTRSFLIGLSSDPLAPFSIGGEYEHWGDEGVLTTETFRASFAANSQNWSFYLRPQYRNITLYTNDFCRRFPACPPRADLNSRGIALGVSYYHGPWSASLGYQVHDYDRDLSALGRYPRLWLFYAQLFSLHTMDLITSFEDYRHSLGLRYAFEWGLAGLDEVRSVSKVDGAITYMTELSLSRDLTPQWGLHVRGGGLMADDSDTSTLFAGLGLIYSW